MTNSAFPRTLGINVNTHKCCGLYQFIDLLSIIMPGSIIDASLTNSIKSVFEMLSDNLLIYKQFIIIGKHVFVN